MIFCHFRNNWEIILKIGNWLAKIIIKLNFKISSNYLHDKLIGVAISVMW